MLRTTLATTHPEHDRELIADYRALYAAGETFRARIKRFLLQNEMEPGATYELRCREASYRTYAGPIVDYFAAFLLSSGFVVRSKDDAGENLDPDDAYSEFNEDCDGNGTDLDAFLRARVADALVARRAWWRLEMPDDGGKKPADRAEWEARGLDRVTARDVDPCELLDWSCDESGALEWVTTYTRSRAKRDPRAAQPKTRHEWRIYDATTVDTFCVELSDGEAFPDDIPLDSTKPHGFTRVPFVCLDVSETFWVLARIAAPQVEHFRLSAGLGWAIRRSCYAMPVFKIAEDSNGEYKPPRMGAGYYLIIGDKDDMTWAAPPDKVFTVVQEEIKSQKDEIFRLVHQMALGVENNAGTVGRSAASKIADAEAVKVILTSLGSLVRNAIEKTFALISDARQEPHTWTVEGLDVYDDIDAAPLAETVAAAMPLQIPSQTFEREVKTRLALALVASADQDVKDAIRQEIKDNLAAKAAAPQPQPGAPGMMQPHLQTPSIPLLDSSGVKIGMMKPPPPPKDGAATPAAPKDPGGTASALLAKQIAETAASKGPAGLASAQAHTPTVAPDAHLRASGAQAPAMNAGVVETVHALLEDDYPPKAIDWLRDPALVESIEGPRLVPLEQIDFTNQDNWSANEEDISGYVDKIAEGKLKPIVLVNEPNDEKFMIVDGHHRALAYEKLGKPAMAYIVHTKTVGDPRVASMHSSQTNGKDSMLTSQQKPRKAS